MACQRRSLTWVHLGPNTSLSTLSPGGDAALLDRVQIISRVISGVECPGAIASSLLACQRNEHSRVTMSQKMHVTLGSPIFSLRASGASARDSTDLTAIHRVWRIQSLWINIGGMDRGQNFCRLPFQSGWFVYCASSWADRMPVVHRFAHTEQASIQMILPQRSASNSPIRKPVSTSRKRDRLCGLHSARVAASCAT